MRFFILILFFSQSLIAQKEIDLNDFDYNLLEKLVLEKINKERKKKNLGKLKKDKVLGDAAKNHSNYQAKKKKMTHNQVSSKARTAMNRVEIAGGGFKLVGENVAYADVFGTVRMKVKGRMKSFSTKTYENVAEILFLGWKYSKLHYKAIVSKNYEYSGLKFTLDKKNKRIYATQVFGKK